VRLSTLRWLALVKSHHDSNLDSETSKSVTTNAIDEVMAKHRRAHLHLAELRVAVSAFLEQRTHSLFVLPYDDLTYKFQAHNVKNVPEDIALIAGDVIHNARCALDHLAYRLATKPNYQTSFPILKSPPPNGDLVTLRGGTSDQVNEILGLVQPYGSGINNYLLGVLKDLDNRDKHQLLLPTVCAFQGASYKIEGVDTGDASITFNWGTLENGKDIARLSYTTRPERMEAVLSLIPCVGITANHIEGADILNLLFNILQHVATTAHTFSSFI